MKINPYFILGLCLTLLSGQSSANDQTGATITREQADAQQNAFTAVQLDRAGTIEAALNAAARDMSDRGISDYDEQELRSALDSADAEQLLKMQDAKTHNDVIYALTGLRNQTEGMGPIVANSLGDASSDLVFTPVTPCRVVDTRAGGAAAKLGPFASRSFGVHGNMTSQGGTTCNNPNFDPGAVALTITITEQEGSGYATVYPHGASLPNSSTINYRVGIDTANSTIVGSAINAGGQNDIRVFNNGRSHVIIDIVGYFAAPERTRPDVVATTETSVNVAGGASSGNVYSPACPIGYSVSGGGFDWNNHVGTHTLISEVDVASNRWRCWGKNTDSNAHTFRCSATCLRIPGR